MMARPKATISLADMDGYMSNDAVLSVMVALCVAKDKKNNTTDEAAILTLADLIEGIPDLHLPVAAALFVTWDLILKHPADTRKLRMKIKRLCLKAKQLENDDDETES